MDLNKEIIQDAIHKIHEANEVFSEISQQAIPILAMMPGIFCADEFSHISCDNFEDISIDNDTDNIVFSYEDTYGSTSTGEFPVRFLEPDCGRGEITKWAILEKARLKKTRRLAAIRHKEERKEFDLSQNEKFEVWQKSEYERLEKIYGA